MPVRNRNFIFYSLVIIAPAFTVPWFFTGAGGDAIFGFPAWALWSTVTTIGYCCLLAWGLGKSDWGEDDQDD